MFYDCPAIVFMGWKKTVISIIKHGVLKTITSRKFTHKKKHTLNKNLVNSRFELLKKDNNFAVALF